MDDRTRRMKTVTYLRLDTIAAAITGHVRYRLACWRCYWSPPRVGHPWTPESGGLYAECSRCPKVWIGNT